MSQNVNKPGTLDVLSKKLWNYSPKDTVNTIPGVKQTPRMMLRGDFILAKADLNSPVSFWASLQTSEINPGKLLFDADQHRGWYQDLVTVDMSIVRKNAKGEYERATEFILMDSGPETHNGSGSVSSSVSFTFSANFSGGFFGDTVTANAGGSASVSETHSFSHGYSDFDTDKDSEDEVARTTYKMEIAASGAKYSNPVDLFPATSPGSVLKGLVGALSLYDVPALAKHDLQLISQAVWQANTSDWIAKDGVLLISITQRLAEAEILNAPGPVFGLTKIPLPRSGIHTLHYSYEVPLPFSGMKKTVVSV